ncbi:pentatricopeptide repeat-containing protein At3g53360, mitochondrial-like [Salvia miltiorrhiza]|uniref:pentatricopeptide repeat-containing protein At3g53360, mitochondrial-like n=1 Tax=Salvia miltiorrhiza TaxID=226208 RepID=UPI0025AD1D7B|nr:pentatricopeptide repeat-containing protein At3g53360, mitochondrial-like [Salvia miltiorrhiza]
MKSLHLNSPTLISPSLANTPNPKISRSFPQHSSPPENIFSDQLLSLRRCVQTQDLKTGSSLHATILKSGLEADVFIANSLLNMYSKCDCVHHARNVFDQMPHRTVVSWTAMMSAYHRSSLPDEAMSLFSRMPAHLNPNEFTLAVLLQACALRGDVNLVEAVHSHAIRSGLASDSFLQNCLIDAYAKAGMLTAAEKLLLRLCRRDVVSWTCVVSGCVKCGEAERGLSLFCRMQEDGVAPSEIAMVTALQACSEIGNGRIMGWIHGLVLKGNWWMSGLVLNSLIGMYSTNGYFTEAMAVFRRFCFGSEGLHPSPETMASLLHGCGRRGALKLGGEIHGYLIKHGFLPCVVAENSLMNVYAEHGYVDSALLLFRMMAERDVISWNTIIKCFVKNGRAVDALRLLREIHREGCVSPDFVTLLTSLEACSELARITEGRVIHGHLTKTGLLGDIFLQNALIDMYAKSGRVDFADCVFEGMQETDIGSWNSIIAAYGVNGDGASAVKAFEKLEREGTKKPNGITFTNALSACAHAGLVEEGCGIFHSMEKRHGMNPSTEHYACVVDLLGRAGRVKEAEAFIDKMPMLPGSDVWGALLSASVLVGDVAMAERAAEELAALEPSSSIWRVALANAYAAAGKWDRVAELRGLRKEGGWSCVNVEGFEFDFFAGDARRGESEMIYQVIGWLQIHMQDNAVCDEILFLT